MPCWPIIHAAQSVFANVDARERLQWAALLWEWYRFSQLFKHSKAFLNLACPILSCEEGSLNRNVCPLNFFHWACWLGFARDPAPAHWHDWPSQLQINVPWYLHLTVEGNSCSQNAPPSTFNRSSSSALNSSLIHPLSFVLNSFPGTPWATLLQAYCKYCLLFCKYCLFFCCEV